MSQRLGKLLVESFYGFGDNLFLRPIIVSTAKNYEKVYLKTPYPELFRGTPIEVVRPDTTLYPFAQKEIERHDKLGTWKYQKIDRPYKFLRPTYAVEELHNNYSIQRSFSNGFVKDGMRFDLRLNISEEQNELGRGMIPKEARGKKICIVKIPSYRHDWHCDSRTPKTEYFIACMKILKARGYYIISMQDFSYGDRLADPRLKNEWVRLCDLLLHTPLTTDQILGFCEQADMFLTYPNFFMPLAISLDKPVFGIFGGFVHPELVIDPRMKAKAYQYIAPDPFCNCILNHHDCFKDIPMDKLVSRFTDFLNNPTSDLLSWREDMGYAYYPVDSTGVYDDEYFNKYVGYENSTMGEELNEARKKLALKWTPSGKILDVGVGSLQFVRSVDGFGYDVNPKAIQTLKDENRWMDLYGDTWGVNTVTFFDSFEHIDDINDLVVKLYPKTLVMSIPIFRDKDHILKSKHFRKDEHYHYFTESGLKNWMAERNYRVVFIDDFETRLGREDIKTFVFEPVASNEKDFVKHEEFIDEFGRFHKT